MKRYFWILALFFPLALTGCETMDKVTSWFDDEDAQAETVADEESALKYVTVVVKGGQRYGFKIKDPMGQRTTGGSCGTWEDQVKEIKGACCWNIRGECDCPCPE